MLKYIFNTEWCNTVWAAHRFPLNFIKNQTHLKWERLNSANRFWIWSFVTNFYWNQFRFGSKNSVWKTNCWPSFGTECKLTGRSYILISGPTRYGSEWVMFMLASVYQSRRLWVCSGKSDHLTNCDRQSALSSQWPGHRCAFSRSIHPGPFCCLWRAFELGLDISWTHVFSKCKALF